MLWHADGAGQVDDGHAARVDLDHGSPLCERLAVESQPAGVDLRRPRCARLVDEHRPELELGRLDGEQPVGIGATQRVPHRLASPVAVHGRPRDHRPAVVQLPHDRPGADVPDRPQVLHAQGDGACLVELREEQPVVEVRGHRKMVRKSTSELAHPVGRLLVMCEHGRVDRQLPGADGPRHGRPGRRRLVPELGGEARSMLPVRVVVELVPDVPDVLRAVVRVVGRSACRQR